MIGFIRIILIVAVAVYACLTLFMYLQQRSLQYHPSHRGLTPETAGLTGVSEERITTPDGETLIAWYAAPKPGMPTVLFFHGNGGEIGGRTERLSYYMAQGFGALFVSYRGYGGSTGSISERGFMIDAVAAYDWLIGKGATPQTIVLVGESLGTGVAVQLAARKPVAALALEAPYTATVDVAAEIYWWLPVRLLMKDTYKSRDFIGEVHVPVLVQHGTRDSVIPFEHGQRLFELANEPKEFVSWKEAEHEVVASERVWEREVDFFRRYLKLQ
jgi:fermentation-respiration switch protein FrsA (DUF1100 family)